MKLRLFSAALLAAALLLTTGCDNGDEDDSGIVTVTGFVINSETEQPVPEALVRILPPNVTTETNADGRFEVDVEIDSTMNLNVTATKEGFTQTSRQVLAIAGREVEVPNLRVARGSDAGPESGRASNILLMAQSSQSIGVRESGSTEVAQITFQATDSLGRPVTVANAADISFTFGQNPGGGAFISPQRARTDNQGRATVNLSSGTRAGVVQIVAEAVVDGRTIRSLPVSVTIHGGLPDQDHFSIGPERFNFPGLRTYGVTNPISVIVGDKYGNPVKEGTAVYFTTSHSIIEGSILTNAQGGGSVNLISANPRPDDGVAIVTATTADENQNEVRGETPVLLSGPAVLSVSPGHAELGRSYTVTLTDHLGNPLVQGTSLSVRVEGTKVKAVGSTNVTLGDTDFTGSSGNYSVVKGQGITEFTFRAVDDLQVDEEGQPVVEAITVSTNGPNGSIEIVLTPEGADVASKNASVRRTADGGIEARVED